MVIDLFATEEVVRDCLGVMETLPEGFRPLFFSENETGVDKRLDIWENTKRFEQFVADNPLGFFLHSKYCLFDVSFSGDKSSIFIEVKNKKARKDVLTVLRQLAEPGISYGYAGEWEERLYRNSTEKSFGMNTIEKWMGRDYSKYLPGIYWLNIISPESLARLNQELLISSAHKVEKLENGTTIIQMYRDAEDWEKYAPDLDDICSFDPNIFFKWDIWEQLDELESQEEYLKAMSNWP